MRHGNLVITGRYKMPAQYDKFIKTDVDKDSWYEFDDPAVADAFIKDMTDRGLVVISASTLTVDEKTGAKTYTYTDPATGRLERNANGTPKEFRFAKGDTGTKTISKVTVQDKFVKFYESVFKSNANGEPPDPSRQAFLKAKIF
jgi:hypothetical protein